MGLAAFERRLERVVEGMFARAFRSGLRPVELGRRLTREMDDRRTVDVRGRVITPNRFVVQLSPADHAEFAGATEVLARELADAAREHAADEGYAFLGPVTVELTEDPSLRTGTFAVTAEFVAGPDGSGPGSLVLPDGTRYPLEGTVVIGRLPACDIVLGDAKASRRHAEIRPDGDRWVLVDLGSTNGTRVNGRKITEHVLSPGDEILIGATRLRFEAS